MYQGNVFPTIEGGRADPAVKDINSHEMQYYGKISKRGYAIYPKDELMVTLGQSTVLQGDKNLFCFDFIESMYSEMQQNIRIKTAVGSLPTLHPNINNMTPVRAYTSPKIQYILYFKNLLREFNLNMNDNDYDNITHFDSYVNAAFRYFQNLDERTPITFSGWMTSKESSIFSSGLAISIMDNLYHDDAQNTEFVYNPLFLMYKKLAMNNGFCIIKQAPWIMIADINSPAIIKHYPDTIGNVSTNKVLERYYNLCHLDDILLLYDNLINLYNDFVLFNDEKRTVRTSCRKKTIVEISKRHYLSDGDMRYRNPRKYLSMYIRLRNQEEGRPLTELVLKQVIKKAKTFLDISEATGYVNGIFATELFKKPYGLADLVRRFDNRVAEKRGIEATDEEKQQDFSTGTSMFSNTGGGSSGGY